MNRKALFVGILVLILVIGLTAPLGAKVARSSSRILSIPENIVTTRKAKFKMGDILTNEMVSITIVNDPKPAYLLLVLELEIDSESITGRVRQEQKSSSTLQEMKRSPSPTPIF